MQKNPVVGSPHKETDRPAWWTDADDAELAVLAREFVAGVYEHYECCSVCSQRGPWCEHVRRAFDLLLDWREKRSLVSYAAGLRALADESDTPAKLAA
jgi:hypothetical protein